MLAIVSTRLSPDATCGVTVEPYVQVRRADATTVSAEEVPEEGQSDSRYSLRFRCVLEARHGLLAC
jgi:hypothetical protein